MGSLRAAVTTGLLFGAIGVYVGLTGLLLALHARWVVVDRLSVAHAVMLALGLAAGHVASRGPLRPAGIAAAMLSGLCAAAAMAALAAAMAWADLRWMFIALSAALFEVLSFGAGLQGGVVVLLAAGLATGGIAGAWRAIPGGWRTPLVAGACAVLIAGTFQEIIQLVLLNHATLDAVRDGLYRWDGLVESGAAAIFVGVAGGTALVRWLRARWAPPVASIAAVRSAAGLGLALFVLFAFPALAGSYIGQIMLVVALYALMGMGLNLEFGLAGLLDLGFVAFFAIGAYTTALLTADSPLALAGLSFWSAMPIAVLASVIVGLLFGLPVLGMRGDYLAVATMGLGEIVRVLVSSDFASPLLGGAQGVPQIPRPSLAGHALNSPVQLYYLALVAALGAACVAWRLEGSRLGRAWRAMRDDEDVAQALGIDLVGSKMLAYGMGAGFAGLAGSIFATMVTAIYPSSFQLVVSVNVLALIIVGGLGSLRGVALGAAVLVGLPELLREFGEFRYLFYGAALVLTMRLRPAGLWPPPAARHETRAPGAA